MERRPNCDEKRDLAMTLEGAASTARSLRATMRREAALIEAGQGYGELEALSAEKQKLATTFRNQVDRLQAAGWEVVLELPGAAAFTQSVAQLSEAIQEDMRALQRAMTAIDRVARIVGSVQQGGQPRVYGPEGRTEANPGKPSALNARI